MEDSPIEKIKELAKYLSGFADATQNTKISEAAKWLDKLSKNICIGGVIGCKGGETCASDHK